MELAHQVKPEKEYEEDEEEQFCYMREDLPRQLLRLRKLRQQLLELKANIKAPDVFDELQLIAGQLNELNHLKAVHSLAATGANINKAITASDFSALYNYIQTLTRSTDTNLACHSLFF
ncbi:unnamed protein product [Gongylonema pulchrum]|uniref:FH2 domain-containing protein n=1 Tax=Gongylonema pulchrum TaxID=637853 RepID=A0A183E8I4_9BILA|nr:unnamed protein product [Gongylonema pulchrum]